MEQLDQLKQKLQQLLKAYKHLKQENVQLQQKCDDQMQRTQSLLQQLKQTDDQLLTVQLAATTQDDTARHQLKQQVEQVLKAVEKVLKNWNE